MLLNDRCGVRHSAGVRTGILDVYLPLLDCCLRFRKRPRLQVVAMVEMMRILPERIWRALMPLFRRLLQIHLG